MRIANARYPSLDDAFGNRGTSRFDDPRKIFKTLYCAADFETCYSETLLRNEAFQPTSGRYVVTETDHNSKLLQLLVVDTAQLDLVDLMEPREMGYGYNAGLGPYSQTQALAREFYDHKSQPHGIVYQANFGFKQKPAIVLFDRARPYVRLLPGYVASPFADLPEAFDALTKRYPIVLTPPV